MTKNVFTMMLAGLSVVPATAFAGSGQVEPQPATPVVRDVELAAGGVAHGTVLDSHGQPIAGMPVSVHMNDGTHRTTTDASGRFSVPRLTGGPCVIQVRKDTFGCRLWRLQTAPPGALKSFTVAHHDGTTVRGQNSPNGNGLTSFTGLNKAQLLAIGLAAGATVAIVLAVNDDDSKPSASN